METANAERPISSDYSKGEGKDVNFQASGVTESSEKAYDQGSPPVCYVDLNVHKTVDTKLQGQPASLYLSHCHSPPEVVRGDSKESDADGSLRGACILNLAEQTSLIATEDSPSEITSVLLSPGECIVPTSVVQDQKNTTSAAFSGSVLSMVPAKNGAGDSPVILDVVKGAVEINEDEDGDDDVEDRPLVVDLGDAVTDQSPISNPPVTVSEPEISSCAFKKPIPPIKTHRATARVQKPIRPLVPSHLSPQETTASSSSTTTSAASIPLTPPVTSTVSSVTVTTSAAPTTVVSSVAEPRPAQTYPIPYMTAGGALAAAQMRLRSMATQQQHQTILQAQQAARAPVLPLPPLAPSPAPPPSQQQHHHAPHSVTTGNGGLQFMSVLGTGAGSVSGGAPGSCSPAPSPIQFFNLAPMNTGYFNTASGLFFQPIPSPVPHQGGSATSTFQFNLPAASAAASSSSASTVANSGCHQSLPPPPPPPLFAQQPIFHQHHNPQQQQQQQQAQRTGSIVLPPPPPLAPAPGIVSVQQQQQHQNHAQQTAQRPHQFTGVIIPETTTWMTTVTGAQATFSSLQPILTAQVTDGNGVSITTTSNSSATTSSNCEAVSSTAVASACSSATTSTAIAGVAHTTGKDQTPAEKPVNGTANTHETSQPNLSVSVRRWRATNTPDRTESPLANIAPAPPPPPPPPTLVTGTSEDASKPSSDEVMVDVTKMEEEEIAIVDEKKKQRQKPVQEGGSLESGESARTRTVASATATSLPSAATAVPSRPSKSRAHSSKRASNSAKLPSKTTTSSHAKQQRKIISHFIDGHVLYESNLPFPVRNGMAVVRAALQSNGKRSNGEESGESTGKASEEEVSVNHHRHHRHQETQPPKPPETNSAEAEEATPKTTARRKHGRQRGTSVSEAPGAKRRRKAASSAAATRIDSSQSSNDPPQASLSPPPPPPPPMDVNGEISSKQVKNKQNGHRSNGGTVPMENVSTTSQSTPSKMDMEGPKASDAKPPVQSSVASPKSPVANVAVHAARSSKSPEPSRVPAVLPTPPPKSPPAPSTSSATTAPATPAPEVPEIPEGPVNSWNPSAVAQFVRAVTQNAEYARAFLSHEIDGEAFALLKATNLIEAPISMKAGHALKLVHQRKLLTGETD